MGTICFETQKTVDSKKNLFYSLKVGRNKMKGIFWSHLLMHVSIHVVFTSLLSKRDIKQKKNSMKTNSNLDDSNVLCMIFLNIKTMSVSTKILESLKEPSTPSTLGFMCSWTYLFSPPLTLPLERRLVLRISQFFHPFHSSVPPPLQSLLIKTENAPL